jgi:hypothetical protein
MNRRKAATLSGVTQFLLLTLILAEPRLLPFRLSSRAWYVVEIAYAAQIFLVTALVTMKWVLPFLFRGFFWTGMRLGDVPKSEKGNATRWAPVILSLSVLLVGRAAGFFAWVLAGAFVLATTTFALGRVTGSLESAAGEPPTTRRGRIVSVTLLIAGAVYSLAPKYDGHDMDILIILFTGTAIAVWLRGYESAWSMPVGGRVVVAGEQPPSPDLVIDPHRPRCPRDVALWQYGSTRLIWDFILLIVTVDGAMIALIELGWTSWRAFWRAETAVPVAFLTIGASVLVTIARWRQWRVLPEHMQEISENFFLRLWNARDAAPRVAD